MSGNDIVLLAPDWKSRALIRAQLIEEGYDVVATDEWTVALHTLQSAARPTVLIVDLEELPEPAVVLRALHRLMTPDRVIVLGGLGTVPAAEVRALGFRLILRPFEIRDVIAEAAHRLEAHTAVRKRSRSA